MRLLNVDNFKLEDFFYADSPPPYAILSHTWGSDSEEMSYRDVLNGRLNSTETRPPKVTGCCIKAKADGYQYVWIDTCCIDKTNSVELQEAINSMFRWYRNAAICYAYLSDVPSGLSQSDAMSAFSSSRWFQRGWTLQELIAPLNMRFYDAAWACIGTKGDLCDLLETVTGIQTSFLLGIAELHHASVAQRMSWASKRVTKRQEDMAYCLLGIFGVSMPMIYGEGDKAFRRLQEKIMKEVGDVSILAWDLDVEGDSVPDVPNPVLGTALAPTPSYFANSSQVVASDHAPLEVRGGSLHLPLDVLPMPDGQILGFLKCGHERHRKLTVAIPLVAALAGQRGKYFRNQGRRAILREAVQVEFRLPFIHIQLDGVRNSNSQAAGACWFHIRNLLADMELIGVHPAPCWHRERALIEIAFEPTGDTVQRVLVRFRDKTALTDFVAVIEPDAQRQLICSLMVASPDTTLEEIASHPEIWGTRVFGKGAAWNGSMALQITLMSQASPSQRRFVLELTALSKIPPVTINATVLLRTSGALALLEDMRHINRSLGSDAQELEERADLTKQKLAEHCGELEKRQAEIQLLQLKKLRMAELHRHDDQLRQDLLKQCGRAKRAEAVTRERMLDIIKFIKFYGRDPETWDDGYAPAKTAERILPFALERGYVSLTRVLIGEAQVVTVKDVWGSTALHYAVQRGEEAMVRSLIESGADVNTANALGVTPLRTAAQLGHESIVRLLLEHGAEFEMRATNCRITRLGHALHDETRQVVVLPTRYVAETKSLSVFENELTIPSLSSLDSLTRLLVGNSSAEDQSVPHSTDSPRETSPSEPE